MAGSFPHGPSALHSGAENGKVEPSSDSAAESSGLQVHHTDKVNFTFQPLHTGIAIKRSPASKQAR